MWGDFMWFLVGVQLFVIILFGILGWAILKKEAYSLISNFRGRSEVEQRELIENGYPQRAGKLLVATAGGMIILLPLAFTSFDYTIEIQFGFMLFFLLGGVIYLSKYEVQSKRRRSYIISSVLAIVTTIFLIGLFYIGYKDFEVKMKEDTFEITGVYGDDWEYTEIRSVELLEDMPEVTLKQNGFGLSTVAKGQFKVKDYGSSLLFIHKGSSPYLLIELESKRIFINSKDSAQTKEWHDNFKQFSK